MIGLSLGTVGVLLYISGIRFDPFVLLLLLPNQKLLQSSNRTKSIRMGSNRSIHRCTMQFSCTACILHYWSDVPYGRAIILYLCPSFLRGRGFSPSCMPKSCKMVIGYEKGYMHESWSNHSIRHGKSLHLF
jgi:hypothetical protein